MKTNKILLTTAIIVSLGTSVFAADTTVGTGNGIAYGTTTETSTSTSIAIGNTVKSSGQDSIGIGYDVTVDGFNSIAIGSSRNKPGVENNPQKTIVTGTKNIGIGHKVEISNGYESVAIGSDARVYNIDKNDVYKDTSYSTVIGSSASSTGAEGTAYGRKSTANGDKATALGSWARANGENSAAIAYGAKANGGDSIAVGNNSEANGRYSTAIGRYAIADGEYSMTIGSDSHANNTNSIAIGNFAIANGENNIALGYNSSSTDVVKTSHASIIGHDYKFAGSDPIGTLSIGGTIEVPVLDANGEPIMNEDYTDYLKTTKEVHRTITNVAAGRISEESTDAVNGSQLHAVIKAVNEVAANDKDTITTVVAGANTAVTNDGNHNYTVSVNKDLTNMNSVNLNDASGTKRARLDADKAHFFNDTTSTNTAVTANGLAIENTDNLDQANYGINGMTASGPNTTVSFTTDGINAGNQIINGVKAGVKDTDAVNVSQLNKVEEHAAKNTEDIAGLTTKVENNYADLNKRVNTNAADIRANTATILDHEGRIIKNEKAIGENSANIQKNADAIATNKTAINNNSKVLESHTKTLTNHEVRITDLENKVDEVGASTLKAANSYTDSQVAHVGAQSAALAGLHPLDFNKDDKASYAASVGHYRNANAVAVGAFYRPNERTMISTAVSFGKHTQMNLGVAFKTGKGAEYINEAKSKDSRIEKLEALVEKLTAEVQELKANK